MGTNKIAIEKLRQMKISITAGYEKIRKDIPHYKCRRTESKLASITRKINRLQNEKS